MTERLRGCVTKVRFVNPETSHTIFDLRLDSGETVSAAGRVPKLREGETVCVSGETRTTDSGKSVHVLKLEREEPVSEPESGGVLRGTVESVRYFEPESGFVVADLKAEDTLLTIRGEIGQIAPGEEVELTGAFVTHPKYGRQFHAESCRRQMPATAASMERFLGSGAVPGVRRRLAEAIVAEFGEFTFDVIRDDPMKLTRIKGISARKAKEIAKSVSSVEQLFKLTENLAPFGVSSAAASRIYALFGDKAWEKIRSNPYLLCAEDVGVPFETAEKAARSFELPEDFPPRIQSAFQCVLETAAAEDGHTCLPQKLFLTLASRTLSLSEERILAAYRQAAQTRALYEYEADGESFVYLPKYYRAEFFIAQRLGAMAEFSPDTDFDCESAIEKEQERTGITYAQLQKRAIAAAFSRGIVILTGGPGTGKTTTLNAVIHLCARAGSKVLLAAPTGRSAKRMEELTGKEAMTIHRMLGADYDDKDNFYFKHDERDPLAADVVIIDEFSMVDTLLFEALLRALRLSCRLVLVGDEDQLPSVGAGQILHALIASERLPVVRLTKIFRQAQESLIVRNAHRIVRGELPDLNERRNDFFFLDRRAPGEIEALLLELYTKRLPNTYGFDPARDIQVISPRRKDRLGTNALNVLLQNAVNAGKGAALRNTLFTFREGDKVMQNQNQYDARWKKDDGEEGMGIYNGDIGRVVSVSAPQGALVADFDGRKVTYGADSLSQLELAYAVTVHKSQGNEFEAVILILPEGSDRLSYRSLLYTAVTRARRLLVVIGSPRKFAQMVQNESRAGRFSCLTHMLCRSLPPREEERYDAENDPD